MPLSTHAILIVNEHAEEIKLVAISVRGFFPEVRIDIAYSPEEAAVLASATAVDWSMVLIDDACLANAPPTFIDDLKRQSSYASIIFQSGRTDSASALQALQVGADFFLYKHSPAFLTELLFCTKEALDKRDWHLAADRGEIRHRLLIESLGDVFYELDAEGRFITIGPSLLGLLGYRPEELMGRSYHVLFSEAEKGLARFRFNERRTGTRAVTGLELTLQGKRTTDSMITFMTAEISARGLYDSSRRFIGTVGIIRDVSARKKEQMTIQALQQQLHRMDELGTLAQQITALSRDLQQPLSTLLHESKQLSDALHEAHVTDRLAALTGHAAASAQLGERLANLVHEASRSAIGFTINDLLTDLLDSSYPEQAGARGIRTDFAASLPDYHGDRERTIHFFQHLLAYAGAYLSTASRSHTLEVKTTRGGLSVSPDAPTLFPLTPTNYIDVHVIESEREQAPGSAIPSRVEPIDLLGLYRLARDLGATLDVSAPATGPLHMTVRLPTGVHPPPRSIQPKIVEVPVTSQAAEPSEPTQRTIVTQEPSRPVATDRRSNSRVPTRLQAVVTIGSSTWNGIVINLSLGGACIGLSSEFPSIALQEAYIVARTAVGILELTGLVYERTTSQTAIPSYSHMIIVAFQPPKQTEAAVLASLIEAAREQSLAFTLEILLATPARASQATAQSAVPDFVEQDRREAIRIPLSLPARLETMHRQEPASRLVAQVVNLSRTGACLVVKEHPDNLQHSVSIHFAPANRSGQLGSHEPGAPDTVLAAEIVWSIPDPTASSTLYAPHAARTGVRFLPLTPYAERELNRVIKQHMLAQRTSDALSTSAPVVSVPRECRNARGQAIAITDDHLVQMNDPNLATIIIAPGYGQTALDYAAFSYYLAEHHFRILRYDPTNHIGNSEGELQQTTLRSMQHDLAKVIEFVRHTWPQAPVLVIASDLAARAALKTAVQTRPLDLLLLINPSIDVGNLLMSVHGHDLIADHQFGLRRGICNLLGLNVNVDQLVGDLIAGHFADLESTLEDLRLLRAPLCIATSPATSTAIPPADLPHAFMTALGAHSKLVNISTPLTERDFDIQGSPPGAFKQILKQITSVLSVPTIQPQQEISTQSYVARQRRIEQEYTLLRHDVSHISREALCAAHLSQLPQVGNLHEYRKLLDDLYGLMSPLEPGAVLVDIGVGQSDLTRAALVNHTYRAGHASWTGRPSPLLVGVGRSGEAIGQARSAVHILQRELASGFVGRLSAMPPLTIGWVQADWTHSLPFKAGSLDRLVCNLSLPYVLSPLAALREWHRAVHPEGCLILTTFHPGTDLSALYRRHLRQANQDEFSAQAQPLLNYFGHLREAIRHGILHTFDETGLAALLRQCGMISFRILPIFDGQALVAVVGKRNSSSSIR